MDRLLDQFINYLKVERGLAKNTVESYSRDLLRFSTFLEDQGFSPIGVSRDQIAQYITLLGKDLAARSVARNISAISRFFGFLFQKAG